MKQKQIQIVEKHSRILRYTHWLNFVFLSIMVWSGILIYWADDAWIKIPNKVAELLSIKFKLAEGMGWHFFIMWGFFLNGLVYVVYMIKSHEWKQIMPNRHTFKEAIFVILHDLKLSKHAPISTTKFNAAQRIAYSSAILMGLGSLISGLAIYKPVTLGLVTDMLGGYRAARFEHFCFMVGFILFFIVHIIQVARAGWNNFRAMIAGYEIEKD